MLLLLLLLATSHQATGAIVTSELRCKCPRTQQRIDFQDIQSLKVTPPGPHCTQTEVIAIQKDGQEVCLDPEAPLVQRIIQKILKTFAFSHWVFSEYKSLYQIMLSKETKFGYLGFPEIRLQAHPCDTQELRCQCIRLSSDFISPKFIKAILVIPENIYCSRKEVIALLENGKLICLNPEAEWMKDKLSHEPMYIHTQEIRYRLTAKHTEWRNVNGVRSLRYTTQLHNNSKKKPTKTAHVLVKAGAWGLKVYKQPDTFVHEKWHGTGSKVDILLNDCKQNFSWSKNYSRRP
ncbi:hypothetical protein STEG23_006073, partial [Scotinomys teguina]